METQRLTPLRNSCSLCPLAMSNTRMTVPFSEAEASMVAEAVNESAARGELCAGIIVTALRLTVSNTCTSPI